MKLGGRERMDDTAALEALFAELPVSADWTLGFLTAICSGPDAIAPAMWIPAIMPDAAGADERDPVVRAKIDLLARVYGAAAETLRTSPAIIPPEPDKPAQEAADFCRGYLHGARMHETWSRDEVATQALSPFEALAAQTGDAAETTALRERLGSCVAELHVHWQSKRQVVNTTPKVGRNDPCPCGSGKKHKKCCQPRGGPPPKIGS